MDEIYRNNYVLLRGAPRGEALWSHAARSQDFFTLPLEVRRLSGASDTLNVTLRASMLPLPAGAGRVEIEGGIAQNYYNFICHFITPADYEAAKKYVSDPEAYDFKKILNW